MKLITVAGATSIITQVFIQDSSSTTGAGLAGLVFNSSGLTAYYHRSTDTTATALSLVTMTVGTYTTNGFKEIDASNMPGWYQFCPANAAFAAGAKNVAFHLKGATNMAPLPLEVQVDTFDLDSATPDVNVKNWNGTVVATPATAGIPDVNVKNINNVATTSVGTINATIGTTQSVNHTGTGSTALVKVDVIDWNSTVVSTPATAGIPDVNVKNINNTAAATPGASGGILISGTNSGTTSIAALTIPGSIIFQAGMNITQSALNQNGISTTGNGTGNGLSITGGNGASGAALKIFSNSTNGTGIDILGTGTNAGMTVTGGTTGSGIKTVGTGGGHGIEATGSSTGHGILATSGNGATGDGIKAVSIATNGNGLDLVGNGTGNGLLSTGGAGAGGDGAEFAAGGGVDVRGNITGSITSVTNGVTVAVGGLASTGFAANAIDSAALATSAANEIADAVKGRQLAESYAADTVAPTLEQALFSIQQNLTQFSIAGTLITVQKIDKVSTAQTYDIDSSTVPTLRKRTT